MFCYTNCLEMVSLDIDCNCFCGCLIRKKIEPEQIVKMKLDVSYILGEHVMNCKFRFYDCIV